MSGRGYSAAAAVVDRKGNGAHGGSEDYER